MCAVSREHDGQGVAALATSVRERMTQHRANQPCKGCHQLMDPIGLALENFDGVGRWRTNDSGQKIDASGQLVDGTPIDGVETLRNALLSRSDAFVQTMTEKLLMYAVGRASHFYDMPAIRAISAKRPKTIIDFVARCRYCEQRAVSDETKESGGDPMNFIAKKHLSRRTLLRGAGVTLALPFLESMVPAQTLLKNTAANPKTRLGCFYVPHGATMYKWTPATEGKGFEMTESLSPLEKYRDRLNVISNLAHAAATGADAGAEHARSAAIFLSGGRPQKNTVRVGTTIDQIAAAHIGQDTPLPSIELAIEDVSLSCGAGYGCAYFNTISWSKPTVPLPMENSPQVVFEKLFGDGGTTEQRLTRKREDRSILDSILEQTVDFKRGCRPRTKSDSMDTSAIFARLSAVSRPSSTVRRRRARNRMCPRRRSVRRRRSKITSN